MKYQIPLFLLIAGPIALPLALGQTSPAPATRPASAQPAATQSATMPAGPQTIQLKLTPSATTKPSLRYKLLPEVADLRPGNAVTLYLFARSFWPDMTKWNEYHGMGESQLDYQWDPVEKLPQEYIDRILAGYANMLKYTDMGARRRDANWGSIWREQGYEETNLPYLHDMRHVGNVLGFRSRVEAFRKNWDRAAYSLQTELGMAHHLATEPLLIHARIQAIHGSIAMSSGIEEWITRGDSPNLYWSLTALPQPFVELTPVVRWEKEALRHWKPQFALAFRGELPPGQWPEVLQEIIERLQERKPPYKRDPVEAKAAVQRLVESALSRAKAFLLTTGVSQPKLESIPPAEAVGTYLLQEYQASAEELWKGWALPYPQAEEQMLRFWRELAPDKSPMVDNPLIQYIWVRTDTAGLPDYRTPELLRSRLELSQIDRQIAMLRIVEALRDYAARNTGLPPERLDQITELPIPLDPITDKAFSYRLEGRTAILEAAAPPTRTARSGMRYELTFAQ